jgi:hypothetical protein
MMWLSARDCSTASMNLCHGQVGVVLKIVALLHRSVSFISKISKAKCIRHIGLSESYYVVGMWLV